MGTRTSIVRARALRFSLHTIIDPHFANRVELIDRQAATGSGGGVRPLLAIARSGKVDSPLERSAQGEEGSVGIFVEPVHCNVSLPQQRCYGGSRDIADP